MLRRQSIVWIGSFSISATFSESRNGEQLHPVHPFHPLHPVYFFLFHSESGHSTPRQITTDEKKGDRMKRIKQTGGKTGMNRTLFGPFGHSDSFNPKNLWPWLDLTKEKKQVRERKVVVRHGG